MEIPPEIFSLRKFHIRVWDVDAIEETCLFTKMVRLNRYTFIGTVCIDEELNFVFVASFRYKATYEISSNIGIERWVLCPGECLQ